MLFTYKITIGKYCQLIKNQLKGRGSSYFYLFIFYYTKSGDQLNSVMLLTLNSEFAKQ